MFDTPTTLVWIEKMYRPYFRIHEIFLNIIFSDGDVIVQESTKLHIFQVRSCGKGLPQLVGFA